MASTAMTDRVVLLLVLMVGGGACGERGVPDAPAVAGVAAEPLPGCLEPPGNNGIADIIVNALEAARPFLSTGIPSIGIPPLDPFGPLPAIMFNVSNDALVLHGSVNETTVRNLAQFIICQVNVTVGIKQKFDLEFRLDNFHVDGYYDMNGLAVSLFPIFGNGNYTLDTYQSGFAGSATVTYSVLSDTISISNLFLDVFFEELVLVMECILGCGDMADFVNKHLSEIGESIFNAVWDNISPVIADAIEEVVNEALKNVSISDIIPKTRDGELGNANLYLEMVLRSANLAIEASGLEPATLPNATLQLGGLNQAELVNGSLSGLSTLRRSGTATVDTVVDWIFLYANIALGPLTATFPGEAIAEDGTRDSFVAVASLEVVDVYITARGDTFSGVFDLDQFVISDLGPVAIDIQGLGVLGWLAGPLTEAIANIFIEDIESILSTQIKYLIQTALNENPWPGQ